MRTTRYKQISTVLFRYVYSNITAKSESKQRMRANNLRVALERLGPTFIKLGQAMSGRPDLFPPSYREELEKLQDRVPPMDSDIAFNVLEEELEKPIDEVFEYISPRPAASASLAQVHNAFLLDGREVAVKIQRPGIKELVEEDVSVLYQVAAVIDRTRFGRFYDFHRFVNEFRDTILDELDFLKEGKNIERIGFNLRHFRHIFVPKVYWESSCKKVLIMEKIDGSRLDDKDKVDKVPVSRVHLAEELLDAYLKQIIEDGFFHADPHLGNLLIQSDGRIALLDMGVVGRLDENMKTQIGKLLSSFAEQDSREVAAVIMDIGSKTEETDIKAFQQDVQAVVIKYHFMAASELGIGRAILDLAKLAIDHHIKMPQGFNQLGRAFLYLDTVTYNLAPDLDYIDFLKRSGLRLFSERLISQNSQGRLGRSLLESNNFLLGGAGQINAVLDKMIKDEITIRFEHEHLQGMIRSLNRSSNRMSFAIIVAGLVVGSSLIIRAGVGGTIFGYSTLGLSGFILAAILGIYLIIKILIAERS